ncbi:MAG: prolyl oligopeptidase family serine peptidase, partial [Acidimicrobiales bacterium]
DHLPDEIPETRAASVAWWPDGSGFAYARYPADDEYHRHIRTHRLGDAAETDPVLVAPFEDPAAWPDVSLDHDGRWYVIHVAYGWTRIDVLLIERTTGAKTTVVEGVDAITAFEVLGDQLIGHTTLGASRGRVVTAPVESPTPDQWHTIVPESDEVIEGVAVAGRRALLVPTTTRATARLRRYDLDGGGATAVPLPYTGSLAGLDADPDREVAVFGFTSFTAPPALYRWTPGSVEPWSRLPGVPDPAAYVVHHVAYPSTDGTEIPLFLIRSANQQAGLDTSTILTGYGGFAVTMSPAWNPVIATHCDGGGLYAVACLRGGAEFGEDWHKAGMRDRKQRVFDDFAAAADWLVATGHAARDRLAIRGGSNGGLLVAVTMTQRPDLCRAVHCAVPLTDMIRFPEFLIARLWVPEYGDPAVADEFAWLYAYSPYHHVVDGTCYPAVLVTTAEEDSRVDPCHARKLAARVQAASGCSDDHPVLVRIETKAGHGQGKPVSKQADEAADVLAFLHWQLGR